MDKLNFTTMHLFVNTVECLLQWQTSGIKFKPLACLKVKNSTYFWCWPKLKKRKIYDFLPTVLSLTWAPLCCSIMH